MYDFHQGRTHYCLNNIFILYPQNNFCLSHFVSHLKLLSGWLINKTSFKVVERCCCELPIIQIIKKKNDKKCNFFCGTFDKMFQTQHTCTYSCKGTSGKKLFKTPMRGFWQKTTAKGIWLGTLQSIESPIYFYHLPQR